MEGSVERAEMVWFLLKGEKDKCKLQMVAASDIADLKLSVKAACPHKLSNLSQSQINIYLKKGDSQALDPQAKLCDIPIDEGTVFHVVYPELPVSTWLKESCSAMCNKYMNVCCRCALLFFSICIYIIIMALSYSYNDVPAFRALVATFVLTAAELLPKICHEEHEDIIEWVFAAGLLTFGLLAARGPLQFLFSEDVAMGVVTGASAGLYKKFALLLICRPAFREAAILSLRRVVSLWAHGQHVACGTSATEPLLKESHTSRSSGNP